MSETMTSKLWNELNDQQAEKACGGDGAAVVSVKNPQQGFAALNYGQFLKSTGLSAKESNDAGNFNPSNIGGVGLGVIISDIATS